MTANSSTAKVTFRHGLQENPAYVKVEALTDTGFIFTAFGSAQQDDDDSRAIYGGVVFFYDSIHIDIFVPHWRNVRRTRMYWAAVYTGKLFSIYICHLHLFRQNQAMNTYYSNPLSFLLFVYIIQIIIHIKTSVLMKLDEKRDPNVVNSNHGNPLTNITFSKSDNAPPFILSGYLLLFFFWFMDKYSAKYICKNSLAFI